MHEALGNEAGYCIHFYLLLFFITFLRRQIITNSIIFQHPNLSYPQGLSLPFEVKCTDYYPVLQPTLQKLQPTRLFYRSDHSSYDYDRTELILTRSPSALTIFAPF